jgi:SAM-dependent methyltransferase
MAETLYAEHPEVYDALYAEKGYDAEVAFVLDRFAEGGNGGDRALVVGCGTGEHSRRLVAEGFEVVGLDKHEAMVERARSKSDATFRVGELPDLPVAGEFDLVWLPFTVVNYLDTDDLAASFEAIGDHLADGGLFVFDQMYADALAGGPTLQCHESDDGGYARLTQVHDLGGERFRWDSLVFTPAGEFFVDTHLLTDHDRESLAELLAALGLSVETYGWYAVPEEAKEQDDTILFVAQN